MRKLQSMNWQGYLWKILKWILKLTWKILLIAIWGTLRLVEIFLNNFNKWLKELIN